MQVGDQLRRLDVDRVLVAERPALHAEERTAPDGSDLGPWLARLFQVLDTPEERRQAELDEDLARFPYVDGDLFAGPIRIPDFNAAMRRELLEAGRFDWTAISPAIFGALFQSVMEPAARRAAGAHYTTERNILKVIEPLFLDDLRAEFARLKARSDSRAVQDLLRFQERLGALRFFDPACGCGNFLIIAYRELRALEMEVLRELRPGGQFDLIADTLSVVDVDQAKFQSPVQRAQVHRIAALGGTGGTLDYVAAWFVRAGEYVRSTPPEASPPRIGFVATNSITQGEQAAQLWPVLFDRLRLEISFAHRTFAWGSDARGMAHVHVTILGLDAAGNTATTRRLFTYEDVKGEPLESAHAVITPYLFDGGGLANPHLVVREEGRPINGLRQLLTGSQPIDGGLTIFDVAQRSGASPAAAA